MQGDAMRETATTRARPFRILSLDGGGIRGLFIAGFLADIEHRLKTRIADHFDLIAGTSTGAIIGMALALHEPAAKNEQFYLERGPKIFTRQTKFKGLKQKVIAFCLNKMLKKNSLDADLFWQSKY